MWLERGGGKGSLRDETGKWVGGRSIRYLLGPAKERLKSQCLDWKLMNYFHKQPKEAFITVTEGMVSYIIKYTHARGHPFTE